MNRYILEYLLGLFFAATILLASLYSGIEAPFIYQGF